MYIAGKASEHFHQMKDSLLSDGGMVLVKKREQSFDMSIGSYDGAKTCDLVGLFLLREGLSAGATVGQARPVPGPGGQHLEDQEE